VPDFITIDFLKEPCRCIITNSRETAREVPCEIEIRLFKSKTKAGDVIERVFHFRDSAPEVTTHRHLAKLNAARSHTFNVKPRVPLLIAERLQHAATESNRRIRKTEEDESHQLSGEQFMVGEKVKQASAFGFLFQVMRAGKVCFAGTSFFET
jgi:hypothetical protein